MIEFSIKLRNYREKAGISQSELARLAGIAPSYVSRVEAGERTPPRRNVVIAIAKALKLSYAERNELLLAASYAPTNIGSIAKTHPTMQLLADVLEDGRVPAGEKDLIAQQLKLILKRYRDAKEGPE